MPLVIEKQTPYGKINFKVISKDSISVESENITINGINYILDDSLFWKEPQVGYSHEGHFQFQNTRFYRAGYHKWQENSKPTDKAKRIISDLTEKIGNEIRFEYWSEILDIEAENRLKAVTNELRDKYRERLKIEQEIEKLEIELGALNRKFARKYEEWKETVQVFITDELQKENVDPEKWRSENAYPETESRSAFANGVLPSDFVKEMLKDKVTKEYVNEHYRVYTISNIKTGKDKFDVLSLKYDVTDNFTSLESAIQFVDESVIKEKSLRSALPENFDETGYKIFCKDDITVYDIATGRELPDNPKTLIEALELVKKLYKAKQNE